MTSVPPPSFEESIAALQAGRDVERHFEVVFRAYHKNVTGYFDRNGIPREVNADLTQEVFMVVLASIGSLRSAVNFRSWLFGIARNKLLQHFESRRHEGQAPAQDEGEENWHDRVPDSTPGALEQTLEKERHTKLLEALEELPQQMRACVKLSVVEDLDYAEIGRRLGLSVNTVKVHIHRARQNLAARLGPMFRAAGYREPG